MRQSDLGLQLLSFAMAMGLLFVVHGEQRVSYTFSVPLEARLPAGLGPVTIDLSRTGPGVASWFVRPESLHLPSGVRVESLYPSQGTVDLRRDRP